MKRSMRNLYFAALGIGLCTPGAAAAAIPLVGKALELTGRMHLSLDASDTDGPEGSNIGVSSNTSYVGLRGVRGVNETWTLQWQIEQEIEVDDGSGGWASRNTYLGMEHIRLGTLRVGYQDTPYKTMGGRWSVLTDTVADRRAILGAGAESNNVMNQRARNSVMYLNKVGGLEYQLMYAAQGQAGSDGSVDDNDNAAISGALWYRAGALELSAAAERWSGLNTGIGGGTDGRATGVRFAAQQSIGQQGRVGAIVEIIDTSADNMAELDRNMLGVNGSYRSGAYVLDAQLMFAGNRRGLGDSGAINLGLGVTRQIDPMIDVYGAFSVTDNEANAQYKATDGGHGDEVGTVPGGTPMVISAGIILRF